MQPIENKPIPLKSKGLTGDLKRLKNPTDSFLIENKGLKRAVLYATASRLGIRIITQPEADGLRVWRNFEVEEIASEVEVGYSDEEVMSRQDTIAGLRKPFAEPVDEWEGWSEERTEINNGEKITYRQHIKSRKVKEIGRESLDYGA